MKAVLTARASMDVEAAAQWCESKREGLGLEFTDRVLEAIEHIEANPQGYAKRIGEARRCELRQFTEYALWFVIRNNAVIIGCLHAKRSPTLARERAAGIIEMPKRKGPGMG